MVFSELRFFLFLFLVLAVHWLLRGNRSRKLWLLITSYAFYSIWDWRFSSLILLSTVVDFYVGRWMHAAANGSTRRKLLLVVSVAMNLGLLGFFKYFNFFADSLIDALQLLGLEVSPVTLQVLLPVGISFYTFQTMSYTIDIYRQKLAPVHDFFDFALFVAFFPQLVAGPIVRASEFLPQLVKATTWESIKFRSLWMLFLVGFFKKACLSDNLSPYVDAAFSDPEFFNAASLWLAVVLYAVQIYCDFSGYSDMAIAIAGLLGYQLTKNFDAPYFSTGITEFWRRWHISLSSWLRDYLYIPLGGNRKGEVRTYINLMITMILGGLWHGASWNFVIWGALHGIALGASKYVSGFTSSQKPAWWLQLGGCLLTFWWVCLAWILFRAPDLSTFRPIALAWTTGIASGEGSLPMMLWLNVAVLTALQWVWRKLDVVTRAESIPMPVFAFFAGITMALLLAFANNNYQPFIYFQF